MENYIVRIYARDSDDSDKVRGMLESVEQETRRPFHTLDALRGLLSSASTEASGTPAASPTCRKPKLSGRNKPNNPAT